MNLNLKRVSILAGGAAVAGLLLLAGAGAASAATPATATPAATPAADAAATTGATGGLGATSTATAPAAAASADSCSSGWTKGWASVDMVIQNDTGSTLTFDPSMSGPTTGHWNERPQATLAPGACEVVNAYVPTDVHVFALNVMYTMPNGDYVPFGAIANATDTQANPYVFSSQPTHLDTDRWTGTSDSDHVIALLSDSGVIHTHYTLDAR